MLVRTRHHGRRRRQHVVLRAGHRHQQPAVPGPARDADQPVAEPAELLRHVVRGPQRRGRRGPDEAEEPESDPGPDPRRPSEARPPAERRGHGDLELARGLRPGRRPQPLVNSIDVAACRLGHTRRRATVTTSPSQIVFTFNQPVNFSTLERRQPGVHRPPGRSPGTPGRHPDRARQPDLPRPRSPSRSRSRPTPNRTGNGTFTYTLNGPIPSTDGKQLQSFTRLFTLNDTTAPRSLNTTVNGRRLTVRFNKPRRPRSRSTDHGLRQTRTDAAAVRPPEPGHDPGLKDRPTTPTPNGDARLHGLPQSQLPDGRYYLVVKAGNQIGTAGRTDLRPGRDRPGRQQARRRRSTASSPPAMNPPTRPTTPARSDNEDFVQLPRARRRPPPGDHVADARSQYDTGILGDENTRTSIPVFVGQVSPSFPGTSRGVTILAQFNSLHGGSPERPRLDRGSAAVPTFASRPTPTAPSSSPPP